MTWEICPSEECMFVTSGSPRPLCATPNGEIIQSEPNPSEENTHGTSEQNVKPVIPII